MFEREHHLRVAAILRVLNADFLAAQKCFFGGGTAIVLSHGEYRESVDIDFIVSDKRGYRTLRERIIEARGLDGIALSSGALVTTRDVRIDQYGIRTFVKVAGVDVKFEIILEGRIELETPGVEDRICGVATLAPVDMAATKLLANSDRWADASTFGRDLIDLAMMEPSPEMLIQAQEKASQAYGEAIEKNLAQAIENIKRTGRLDTCMAALKMDSLPTALVWERIRRLRTKKKTRPKQRARS